MPNVRIRIGASVEADFGALVFRPLVEQAKAARAAVRKELDGIGADMARVGAGGRGGRRSGGTAAGMPAATGGGSGPYRSGAQDNAPVESLRRRRRVHREMESEEDRHNREMEKKAREAARTVLSEKKAEAERRTERISGGTVRAFGGIVRRGTDIASDLARGAGIDLSLANAAKGRFDLEKRATDLSNASYMAPTLEQKLDPKKNPLTAANFRQDPRALMTEVQAVADATALDTGVAMEGLQAFVGKTGDLATGRAVLQDMAILARATGGEMNNIVSAAGDVAANLGDNFKSAEAKGQAVVAVMNALAAQGKVGAVEMKDLASQMAKLAASAPQFEGSVQNNMAAMGALAQAARAYGGAASATQATTSVQGFVNTFGKAARRKEFKAAGVDIENSAGQLLDPEEIIVNALKATKGDTAKMNKLFMDAGAQRVTRGFRNIYNQAELKQKGSGEAAVRTKFSDMRSASMGDKELKDSFNASMQTREAQAQLLKNKLEKELGDAVERLAPEMIKLAPKVTQAVEAFGKLTVWAAKNPYQAAMTGFGAAIMKSVGEEFMRNSTSKMFGMGGGPSGPGGSGAPGGFMGGLAGGSKGATALNAMGAAMAITATAVTLYSAGEVLINKAMDTQKQGSDNAFAEVATGLNVQGALRQAQAKYDQEVLSKGVAGPEVTKELMDAKEAASKSEAALQAQIDAGAAFQKDSSNIDGAKVNTGLYLDALANSVFGTKWGSGHNLESYGSAQDSAQNMANLEAQISDLRAAITGGINTISGGGISVTVKNLPGPGVPGVNPAGRSGVNP